MREIGNPARNYRERRGGEDGRGFSAVELARAGGAGAEALRIAEALELAQGGDEEEVQEVGEVQVAAALTVRGTPRRVIAMEFAAEIEI